MNPINEKEIKSIISENVDGKQSEVINFCRDLSVVLDGGKIELISSSRGDGSSSIKLACQKTLEVLHGQLCVVDPDKEKAPSASDSATFVGRVSSIALAKGIAESYSLSLPVCICVVGMVTLTIFEAGLAKFCSMHYPVDDVD